MKKQNILVTLLSLLIILITAVFIFIQIIDYKNLKNDEKINIEVEKYEKDDSPQNNSTGLVTNKTNSRIYKTYAGDEDIGIYISPSLGITFEYVYDSEEIESVVIKENENVIIVNDSTIITVFEKKPNLSLKQAIEENILKGYDPSKCWVTVNPMEDSSLYGFETAQIEFPVLETEDPNIPWWENAKDCPEALTSTNGVSYYLYDPKVPEKFAFVDKGQAVAAFAPSEYGNRDFAYTIKFMSSIEARINSFIDYGILNEYSLSPDKKHVFFSVNNKSPHYYLYNLESGKSIFPDEDYDGYYVYSLYEITDKNLVWYGDSLFVTSGYSSHGAEGFPGIVKVDLKTEIAERIIDFTNECSINNPENYIGHCIDSYKFEFKNIQENKLTYIESFNNQNEEFSKYNYSIEKTLTF
ncbi:MAG: hypothetical protein WC087_00080 [Candidatus Paceibacterota bacterium]